MKVLERVIEGRLRKIVKIDRLTVCSLNLCQEGVQQMLSS